MSFSYRKGLAYYIPLSEKEKKCWKLWKFSNHFSKEDVLKIAHNLKFDYKVLHQYGVEIKGNLFDTMIAHYLLNPDGRHGMDYLSEMYLNYKPVSIETLIGKKGKTKELSVMLILKPQNTLRKMPILPFNCTNFSLLNSKKKTSKIYFIKLKCL
jgi:DNA polymerase I-like protein with 3'-5' exonuclease and polymerase domains